MKQILQYCIALTFLLQLSQLSAQSVADSTGLLGDNFSLEGALDAFKNAADLEKFEETLNMEDKSVNNLDLNEDGEVDYIRVEDHMEGDVHAIVLQAVLSEEEAQDIAVIEVERTAEESATLQIVGDEYLYGEDIFVEAFEEVATSDGDGGPSADYRLSRIVVNVWFWPSVRYIYRPGYRVYRSPYRWGYYPRLWKPWRPFGWHVYHGRRYHYNHHYRHVHTHRVVRARSIYTPKRRSSKTVVTRSRTVTRVNKNAKGNTVVTKKTKTTKVHKNKNGKLTGTKTTKTKKVTKNKNGKTKKVTKTKKKTKRGG